MQPICFQDSGSRTHFRGPVRLPSTGWTSAAQSIKYQAHYPHSLPSQVLLLILSKFGSCQFPLLQKHQSDSPTPDPYLHIKYCWFPCYKGLKSLIPTDSIQWGKEYVKAVYCHPAYLTYMQRTSWEMLGWRKHKLESRLPGEISVTSDMQKTPFLWQKVKKN